MAPPAARVEYSALIQIYSDAVNGMLAYTGKVGNLRVELRPVSHSFPKILRYHNIAN